MNHAEKRLFLIQKLLSERRQYKNTGIPADRDGQCVLLRSLMNVRPPGPIDNDFLAVQDEYLKEALSEKGITELSSLTPSAEGIYLWQGDITALRCDAIVNAANSGLTGCYQPCHNCIDNCIHTYAGIQLRNKCAEIINEQGFGEPTGQAKITPGYNLPCKYIIHTVGPIAGGRSTSLHEQQLASCYRSCLNLAKKNNIKSIAFCCISTGVFGFPQKKAAEIALQTVREYKLKNNDIEVIFNVFKDSDYEIYRDLLG